MSTKTKTLAKSLHTVTALARVGEALRNVDARFGAPAETPADYIARALGVLGYEGASDPYGLAAKAADILRKGN